MLEQPVTHGYFARADKINDLHLKDYSESSLNFYEIYDRVIMPPMSKEKLIEKLSDAWDQQILRKAKKIEFFAIKKTAPKRGIGIFAATKPLLTKSCYCIMLRRQINL